MSLKNNLFLVNNANQSSIILTVGENLITGATLKSLGLNLVSLHTSEVFFTVIVNLDYTVKLLPKDDLVISVEYTNYKLNKKIASGSPIVPLDPLTFCFSIRKLDNALFTFSKKDSEDWLSRLRQIVQFLKTEVKENCTICMEPLINPSSLHPCNHTFCTTCIKTWKKQSSACPVCSTNYTEVVYANKQRVKVKKRKFHYKEQNDDYDWYSNTASTCHICKSGQNESDMLVCDACNYTVEHIGCVGLDKIPDEDWLCRLCKGKKKNKIKKEDGNKRYRSRSSKRTNTRQLRSGRRV